MSEIGGFFVFVAFAVLGIIGWVFNWLCWKNQWCCFKLYHNPIIQRIFWWFSFSFLCGLTACGISGIVTTVRFGKIVRAVQCAYERVYYDLQYGQLKDSFPRWEGLKNISEKVGNSKKLMDGLANLRDDYSIIESIYGSNWEEIQIDNINLRGKYSNDFRQKIEKLINKIKSLCNNNNGKIVDKEKKEIIFYDCSELSKRNTIIGDLINQVNEVMLDINLTSKKLEDSLEGLKAPLYDTKGQLNEAENDFKKISDDLESTYEKKFLDQIEYYITLAKAFGQIINMIFLCLVCGISFFGIILLMGYTYIKNQTKLAILMHIVWNFVKFFEFLFFMYGAIFGMLFLGLRDAIGYNKYLFGENLEKYNTTYLLPNESAKEFLRVCLNDENTVFTSAIDYTFSNDLNDFYTSYKNLKKAVNKDYNLDEFKQYDINNIYPALRNLDELGTDESSESDIWSDESSSDELEEGSFESDIGTDESGSDELEEGSFDSDIIDSTNALKDLNFNELVNSFDKMINELKSNIDDLPKNLKIENALEPAESNSTEGEYLDSFDCGFLKSDISMIYNTLYDLSIESRILCAISCCIAFFGEIAVNAYLLSMYHYNNTEFREGNKEPTRRNRRRNIDVSSRNEFLDKSKPANMKKFNQKLDLDFGD